MPTPSSSDARPHTTNNARVEVAAGATTSPEDLADLRRALNEAKGVVEAVDRSQAMVEFATDGTVLTANRNFLTVMGYELHEIVGQHHRMFCDPADTAGVDYLQFWERLAAGQFEAGEYTRLAKGSRRVWLQATYNPILDTDGTVMKIVKFAADTTAAKLTGAEYLGKVDAIDRAQAGIEFDTSGRVLTANRNFLDAMGYTRATPWPRSSASITGCSAIQSTSPGSSTPSSGSGWRQASSRPGSSSGWPRAAGRCGCRRPTTRSWAPTARS